MPRSSPGETFGALRWIAKPSRLSPPAITSNAIAASLTDRAIGPQCSIPISGLCGHTGTRPKVGLKPTTPQKLAGPLIDPPESVPVATTAMPAATAAPEPPLDPPGVHFVFQGLRVMPWSSLSVTPSQAYSGVCVLPISTAPAFFKRSTTIASTRVFEICSGAREPFRVGQLLVSVTSFMATGMPSSGPLGSPASHRLTEARACDRARRLSTNRQAFSWLSQ